MSKWMLAAALLAAPAAAEEVGEVTTAIKILGANHRIVIEAFFPQRQIVFISSSVSARASSSSAPGKPAPRKSVRNP